MRLVTQNFSAAHMTRRAVFSLQNADDYAHEPCQGDREGDRDREGVDLRGGSHCLSSRSPKTTHEFCRAKFRHLISDARRACFATFETIPLPKCRIVRHNSRQETSRFQP